MQRRKATTSEGVLTVTSYVFRVELAEEDDSRWSAWVEALPGCATWGYTKEEALGNIRDAVEAYIRALKKSGRDVPHEATLQVLNEPVVSVTL
jgi:antitoxin HicB